MESNIKSKSNINHKSKLGIKSMRKSKRSADALCHGLAHGQRGTCAHGEAARRAARERDLKGNHMMAREEVPPALPLAEPVSIDALSDFLREHTGIWAKQQAFDSVTDDRQRVVLGQHQRQRQEIMNL